MIGTIVSLFLAAGTFTADRLTKKKAERRLDDGRTIRFGNGFISFRLAHNGGFAKNRLETKRKVVVAVSSVIFTACVIMYALALSKPAYSTLRTGMGIMMGGAAGNVYDRIVKGKVTDFIMARPLKSIIFNLADVFIVTGAVVTALCELLLKRG